MSSFRIGFTSTTFRQYRNIEKVVSAAEKAGVTNIEWGGDIHVRSVEDAERAKALCDSKGINITSYGSYYTVGSFDKTKWEEICRIAYALGAGSVRVWLGKKDSEKTDENEYVTLLTDARNICDEAKKYGLSVCPECHDGTFNNNTDAILRFSKDLGRDNFRTYFQSRYNKLGYDLDRIERTFDILENVHISYSEQVREQFFGKRDRKYIDTLLKKLREKGFSGIVMLEYTFFAGEEYFNEDIEKLRKY